MLSQLSRLIGLEGRPQANWICRRLINSGKPVFFGVFLKSPDKHTGRLRHPHFNVKPTPRPNPFHNHSNLPPQNQGYFLLLIPDRLDWEGVFVYLCWPACVCVCLCVYMCERDRQSWPSTDFNQIPFNPSDLQESSHMARSSGVVLLCCSALKRRV